MDLLINSRRGVWSLTDRGRTVPQAEIEPLHRAYRTKYNEEIIGSGSKERSRPTMMATAPISRAGVTNSWKPSWL